MNGYLTTYLVILGILLSLLIYILAVEGTSRDFSVKDYLISLVIFVFWPLAIVSAPFCVCFYWVCVNEGKIKAIKQLNLNRKREAENE